MHCHPWRADRSGIVGQSVSCSNPADLPRPQAEEHRSSRGIHRADPHLTAVCDALRQSNRHKKVNCITFLGLFPPHESLRFGSGATTGGRSPRVRNAPPCWQPRVPNPLAGIPLCTAAAFAWKPGSVPAASGGSLAPPAPTCNAPPTPTRSAPPARTLLSTPLRTTGHTVARASSPAHRQGRRSRARARRPTGGATGFPQQRS